MTDHSNMAAVRDGRGFDPLPRFSDAPVSMKALVRRVNRRLVKQGQKLIKTRGERVRAELGDMYVIDTNTSALILFRVNVEVLARELGALQTWQKVAD
jgi:hypothetical protein